MCIRLNIFILSLIEGETTCNKEIINPDEALIGWARMTCTESKQFICKNDMSIVMRFLVHVSSWTNQDHMTIFMKSTTWYKLQNPNICSGSFPAPIYKAVVFPFFFWQNLSFKDSKPAVRFCNFLSMKHFLLLITFSLRWSKELWLARYRHNH